MKILKLIQLNLPCIAFIGLGAIIGHFCGGHALDGTLIAAGLVCLITIIL